MKKLALTCVCFITSLSHADNQSKPPELWSWFKDLDKSAKACEIQSSFVLNKLKIENQTENQYGIYGNIKDNRIVVKCIAIGEKSKLWVAVAGNDKDSVEFIRNLIVSEIQ